MQNKYILAFLWVSITFRSFAQVKPPIVISPSPEVQAFAKYGNIPVSTYTGVPNISIPIYEIVEGDISFPISLSYHASGIKLDQESTWVGLGWSLNASGLITQTINGKPDLEDQLYFTTPHVPNIPTPFIQKECVLTTKDQNNSTVLMDLTNIIKQENYYEYYDFEPDNFTYSFPGASGKFIFDKAGKPILAQRNKLVIEVNSTNTQWTIKTENGFKYTFTDAETVATTINNQPRNIKTAWYLSRIDSPTGRFITFHYTPLFSPGGYFISSVFEQKSMTFYSSCDPTSPQTTTISAAPYQTKQVLTSIEFGQGKVVFDFDRTRTDIQEGEKLNRIKLFRKKSDGQLETNPFKEFLFEYGYFAGKTGDDDIYTTFPPAQQDIATHLQRLKLLSLKEQAGTLSKTPHTFRYYETDANDKLPSKGSFARDFWGYYNGAHYNTSLIPEYKGYLYNPNFNYSYYTELTGANRQPNPSYMKAFSLREVQYPTGGITEFQYEAHDFDFIRSNVNDKSDEAANPQPVSTTKALQYAHGQTTAANVEQELDLSTLYKDPHTGANSKVTVSGAFVCISGNGCQALRDDPTLNLVAGDVFFTLYDANGTQLSNTIVDFEANQQLNCQTTMNACSFSFDYTNLSPGKYKWKLHIKSGVAGITRVEANYTFSQIVGTTNAETGTAGGLRIAKMIDYDSPTKENKKVTRYVYNYQTDKNLDGIKETISYGRRMAKPVFGRAEYGTARDGISQTCLYYTRTSVSNIPLDGTGGTIVGYDSVVVLHGENGEYGKTLFTYENQPDIVFYYEGMRVPGIPNYVSNINGNLLTQIDYAYQSDKSYRKVRETKNQYYATPSDLDFANLPEFGIKVVFPPYTPGTAPENVCFGFPQVYPAIRTDWVRLKSTSNKMYNTTGSEQFLETLTEYEYNNDKHMQVTRTVTRDSKGNEVTMAMKYPQDYATPAPALTEMIARNIINPVIEQVKSVNGKVVSASATEYSYDAAKKTVLPANLYFLETLRPLTSFTNSTDGKTFGQYVKRATYSRYDNLGNILEFSKIYDVPTAYIWGYNQSLPVAKIDNATFADIEAVLGANFHAGSQGLSTTQEQTLRSATQLTKSQITTYTYTPLVGISSSTDANGITMYYEYDALGRLKLIKDLNGHILKDYVYHYKGQQP